MGSTLPPEILFNIVQYLDHDVFRPCSWPDRRATTACIAPFILVSEAWRAAVERLLYRTIRLKYDMPRLISAGCHNFTTHMSQLRANLANQPRRRRFVQKLWLEVDGSAPEADILDAVEQLKQMRSNLKILTLHGGWLMNLDQRLVPQIMQLRLERLEIHGAWGKLAFEHLLQHGLPNTTQCLELYGFHHRSSALASQLEYRPSEDYFLPDDRQYTARLTTLIIEYPDCIHANALRPLLEYPIALQTFHLRQLLHVRHSESYTTYNIQQLLNIQHHSLEDIAISLFNPSYSSENPVPSRTNMSVPDLSSFPCLKTVGLSLYNLIQDVPAVVSSKLCSPTLQHLTIDTDEGGQRISAGRFSAIDAEWLIDFVRHYHSVIPNTQLKTIHVTFRWEDEATTDLFRTWDAFQQEWPNYYLECTKPVLAEYGVELIWNRPTISREEWQTTELYVESVRRTRARHNEW